MTQAPLVSVIIPAWNRAALLSETLNSLQAQTCRNFEAIIVDDGSTDDTAAVVRRFCNNDKRFLLLQQPHGGVSTARNTAIRHASGEWVAFLDADDTWLPEKLDRQLALFREEPRANFTFTNFFMWDGWHDLFPWYRDGRSFPEGDVSSKIVFNVSNACPASMSTAMVRREIFHTIGFFDPELIVCEDWDLWLRLTEHGLWVHGTREPLARYRRWSGNMSNNKLELAKGNVHVLEKNLRATQRPDLRPLYRRSLELAKANFELACARRMLDSSSHYVPAAVWRAWRCHPRRLKWFMWFALVSWPEFLGGRATARIVHRKLIQKF